MIGLFASKEEDLDLDSTIFCSFSCTVTEDSSTICYHNVLGVKCHVSTKELVLGDALHQLFLQYYMSTRSTAIVYNKIR